MTIRPDDDHDFRQLGSGALDRPVALNPTFESRLRAQLTMATLPNEPFSYAMSPSSPRPASTSTTVVRRRPCTRSRWIRSLEPAAALLLVASLALGAIWIRPEGGQERDQRFAANADGSSSAATTSTEGSGSDPAFDADAFEITQVGEDQPYIGWQSWIFDDQMVQIGSTVEEAGGNGALWIRNLETGQVDVGRDGFFYGPVVATATEFLVVQVAEVTDPPTYRLIAIDRETGDVARTLSEFEGMPADTTLNTLASLGETIFVSDSIGTVTAIGVRTGEMRWSTPGEALVESSRVTAEGSWRGGSIVGTTGDVFVATANHTLRKLDASSGEIVEERSLLDLSDFRQNRVKLHSLGDSIAAEIELQSELNANLSAYPDWSVLVTEIDPETLADVRQGTVTGGIGIHVGSVSVNDDLIVVPTANVEDDSVTLSIVTGDGATEVVMLPDVGAAEVLTTGSDGRTLAITSDDGHVRLMRIEGSGITPLADFTVSDDVPGGYLSPITVSNGVMYITDKLGRLHAITPKT